MPSTSAEELAVNFGKNIYEQPNNIMIQARENYADLLNLVVTEEVPEFLAPIDGIKAFKKLIMVNWKKHIDI